MINDVSVPGIVVPLPKLGPGTARITLVDSGASSFNLTGTWSVTFGDPTFNANGTLTGTGNRNPSTVTMTLISAASEDCQYTTLGTLSGATISGSYFARVTPCPSAGGKPAFVTQTGGTYTLTKQ
jgi:hypothetical protein